MKLYDIKKIHEEKIQAQKKKELIEYKKDQEIIPKLKKQFSNQNYKRTSSRKKIYKIEHLLDNAKKLRADHNFDLYDLCCLINTILNKYITEQTLQIKFDKEKLEQIIKSTGISVKLDNKHLTILQELLNRLTLVLTKYKKPLSIEKIIKNSKNHIIGLIDIQFKDMIIDLDYINRGGVQVKMASDLRQCAKYLDCKNIGIYNVATDSLYFIK